MGTKVSSSVGGFGSKSTCDEVAKFFADKIQQKTFVITGCNSGIGFETACVLLERGGIVFALCRESEKTNTAIMNMKPYEHLQGEIHFIPVDLSSHSSIIDAGANLVYELKQVAKKLNRAATIDVLINNAGVITDSGVIDGTEQHFLINYISHVLLTDLLLPYMPIESSRIVNIAADWKSLGSDVIKKDEIICKAPNINISPKKAYRRSKMANIVHADCLAKLGYHAIAVNPGFVPNTNVRKGLSSCLLTCACNSKTNSQGASSIVYCALAPIDHCPNGYYVDCAHIDASSEQIISTANKEAVITITKDILPLLAHPLK